MLRRLLGRRRRPSFPQPISEPRPPFRWSSPPPAECPPADEYRLGWVRERAVLPAEEWAARFGHEEPTWPWADFDYGDEYLNAWVREVPAIITDPERIEAARAKYLTHAERKAVAEYQLE